jgi:hypothetical protein
MISNQRISEEARVLAHDGPLLKQKLRSDVFKEACRRCGVDIRRLVPRRLASFRREKNSIIELDAETTRLRFMAFEEQRLALLTLVLDRELEAQKHLDRRVDYNLSTHNSLVSSLQKHLSKEKEAMRKMRLNRSKYERVVDVENNAIIRKRETSYKRLDALRGKHEEIAKMKADVVQKMVRRGEINQKKLKLTNEERRKREQQQKDLILRQMREREIRVSRFQRAKRHQGIEKKKAQKRGNFLRSQRRQRARDLEQQTKDEMRQRMTDKNVHVERVARQKESERKRIKTMRRLKNQARRENSERLRAAQAYEKELMAKRLEENNERMEKIKEMRRAIEDQRKHLLREEAIRRDRWRSRTRLQRDITPGPGAYEIKSTLNPRGGSMARRVPTEWDTIARHAAESPGPGHYDAARSSLSDRNGTISEFTPMTDIDWKIKNAAAVPGPGHYEPRPVGKTFSASFGAYVPKHFVDIAAAKGRSTPAPGYSAGPVVPARRKKLRHIQKELSVDREAVLFAAKMRQEVDGARRRAQTSYS